jgi:6-pyruvoyltetrahydropterin/6-carboxytetrahydropterin synthase
MYEVTVEAHFSSGHFLREYYGKCENPHGHNYRVLVTLVGAELESNGLLLDFKILKDILKPVVEYLDHHMINELPPFDVVNPSAENLAKYFFDETNVRLKGITHGRVRVKSSTLFETNTSQATYYE